LFGDATLLQGEPLSRCVTVTNAGGAGALDVRLLARVGGDLADALATNVATGHGAGRDCSDFVATRDVFDGTLTGLGAGAIAGGPLIEGASITYRVTVLATASPVGRATLDLTWVGTR